MSFLPFIKIVSSVPEVKDFESKAERPVKKTNIRSTYFFLFFLDLRNHFFA